MASWRQKYLVGGQTPGQSEAKLPEKNPPPLGNCCLPSSRWRVIFQSLAEKYKSRKILWTSVILFLIAATIIAAVVPSVCCKDNKPPSTNPPPSMPPESPAEPPAVPDVPSMPPPKPPLLNFGCLDEEATLSWHNKVRAIHSAPPLLWNNTLARAAQAWAKNLTSSGSCKLKRSFLESRGDAAGETLYQNPTTYTRNCSQALFAWYQQVLLYQFNDVPWDNVHRSFYTVQDFAQVVWVNSKMIGCGASSGIACSVVVCRYSPGIGPYGNREFLENILQGDFAVKNGSFAWPWN